MKNLVVICCIAFSLQACKPTGDSLIWILEEGIEQVQKAKTPEEVSKITYDVRERMMFVGKLPGGDIKLSGKDTRRVMDTQEEFYQAVEKRIRELKYNHY